MMKKSTTGFMGMRRSTGGASFAALLGLLSIQGQLSFASSPLLQHLDLETTSEEYSKLLDDRFSGFDGTLKMTKEWSEVINAGKRNLKWVSEINSVRPKEKQIQLSSAATTVGIPMDNPGQYGPSTIRQTRDELLGQMPVDMKEVIFDAKTTDLKKVPSSIDDEMFTIWAKKVDRLYQTTSRWTMMEQYTTQLALRRQRDIRGYYFLTNLADREAKLAKYKSLTTEEKSNIKAWLINMCFTSSGIVFEGRCITKIESAISAGRDLNSFYNDTVSKNKAIFNSFFLIPLGKTRPDLEWSTSTSGFEELLVPFQDPKNLLVVDYLIRNIHDEWKGPNWALKLDIQSSADIHIEFEDGATPHVNELGGNTITMDANASLDDYSVNWTIRHEFGHILGLPDCYIEFYDPKQELMINYQIDVTNLMCSRAGHLQAAHFTELKRSYRK